MWKFGMYLYQEFSYICRFYQSDHSLCSHNIVLHSSNTYTLSVFQVSSLTSFLFRNEIWLTFMLEELILSNKCKEVQLIIFMMPNCKIKISVDALRIIYFQNLNVSWDITVEQCKQLHFFYCREHRIMRDSVRVREHWIVCWIETDWML